MNRPIGGGQISLKGAIMSNETFFFSQEQIDGIMATVIAKPSFGGSAEWARARLALGLRVGDRIRGGRVEYMGGDVWGQVKDDKIVKTMTLPPAAKIQAGESIAMAAARFGTGVPRDVILASKHSVF